MPQPAKSLHERLEPLKRRLVNEATMAVDMIERSLEALWGLDVEAAGAVRQRDDRIDLEEVAIETECYELLTLGQPVARDFRRIAFVLKVNADVERVADHAVSIAKVIPELAAHPPRPWPMALQELRERVPLICHALLRAMLDEDDEAAREIVRSDKIIDRLDRRLLSEVTELMSREPGLLTTGILIYRIGRELERIGDLMANIAEDVIYLVTGEIVRHAKRRKPQGD